MIIILVNVIYFNLPYSWDQKVSIESTRGLFNILTGELLSNEYYNQLAFEFLFEINKHTNQ